MSEETQVQGQTDKELNFARLRQEKQELERRLAEQEKATAEMREFVERFQRTPEPQDDLDGLEEDDWTTRSHVEKLAARQAQDAVEKALKAERDRVEKERMDKELKELPQKLRSEFADFDQVVTDKNLEYLKAHEPELYATLDAAAYPSYSQAKATYKALKRFCPSPEVEQEKQAIEKNSRKPGSIDSIGQTPGIVADPRRWTPGDKEARWRAMQERARQR